MTKSSVQSHQNNDPYYLPHKNSLQIIGLATSLITMGSASIIFKLLNDANHPQAGDQCLRQIAQLIQNTLHRPVDFCARYRGGKNLLLSYQVVTISLGVATTTEMYAIESYEKLIHLADTALYNAKKRA